MLFGGTSRSASAFVVGVLVFAPFGAQAQDNGGLNAGLSFSQGLTFSESNGTVARSDFGFDLTSVTRTQNFAFSISGAAELTKDDALTFEDPRVSLAYGIENRTSALSLDMSIRQDDADAISVVDLDLIPVLVLDRGTREDRRFGLSYTFGREEPFGGRIAYSYSDTDFTGTTSSEFIDVSTERLSVDLSFEIDPRITTTLAYSIAKTDRDGGRDVETQRLRLGADLAVTQTLTAGVGIGLTEITDDDTVTDGLNYRLSLTEARPNGTLSGTFTSDLSETGRRSRLAVTRAVELPRGSLSGTLGLTEGSGTDIQPTYGLAYTENLPRGSYNISFDQSFGTSSAGEEVLNSNLRGSWQQELTRNARFSTNIAYRLQDFSDSESDESRFDFGINYSQDLNEDWALVTSYSHSYTEVDAGDSDREHSVYVGLETSFGWRP